jgi:ribosomal protein L11 methylase PrmA
MKDRLDNFIELYFEAIEENIEEVIEQLKEEGIDPEEEQQDILRLIQRKKAEIKLQEGEKFKQYYQDATKPASSKPQTESSVSTPRLAARKQTEEFTENEADDIKLEEEKLRLIKKIKDDI